jgi:hypothetical protein
MKKSKMPAAGMKKASGSKVMAPSKGAYGSKQSGKSMSSKGSKKGC